MSVPDSSEELVKDCVSKESNGLHFHMKTAGPDPLFLQILHVFISLLSLELYGSFIGASVTEYKQRMSKHAF